MNLKNFIKKINMNDNKKNYTNILILILIGILLVIGSSFFKNPTTVAMKENTNIQKKDVVQDEDPTTEQYEDTLKNQLKNQLEQIKGIGRVDVIVYCESGEEEVPAFNNNETTSVTTEKATDGSSRNTTQKSDGSTIVVTTKGGDSEALILKKNKPKVTGVFIVAEGAEDTVIELEVSRAISSLYNIPANKVSVYPMKK